MRERYFRKGRENHQEAFHFYDPKTGRIAVFNKDTGKFISCWKMGQNQVDQFLKNTDVT